MNQEQLEQLKLTDRIRRNTTTALRKIVAQAEVAGRNAGLDHCKTLGSIQLAFCDVLVQSEILHCRHLHPDANPYQMVAQLAQMLGDSMQENWNDLHEKDLDS